MNGLQHPPLRSDPLEEGNPPAKPAPHSQNTPYHHSDQHERFLHRRRLPSILLDSWEFRKIVSEGSVLPNALVAWDVDGDGKEEVIVGTTEGHVLVVKPDCRMPLFTRVLAATISVVLYCETYRRLVLITLEGQCEVLDDFLVKRPCTSPSTPDPSAEEHSASTADLSSHRMKTAAVTPQALVQQPELCEPTITSIFHVPSNCSCASFATDGQSDRIFLGSYDRRLYIYRLGTGECIASLFMHHPITCMKTCVVFVPYTAQHRRASAVDGSSSADAVSGAMAESHLVFVATTHAIVLLPASTADAVSWRSMESRQKQPLSLADTDVMAHPRQPSRSPPNAAATGGGTDTSTQVGGDTTTSDGSPLWGVNITHDGYNTVSNGNAWQSERGDFNQRSGAATASPQQESDFHHRRGGGDGGGDIEEGSPHSALLRETAGGENKTHSSRHALAAMTPLTLLHPLCLLKLSQMALEAVPQETDSAANRGGSHRASSGGGGGGHHVVVDAKDNMPVSEKLWPLGLERTRSAREVDEEDNSHNTGVGTGTESDSSHAWRGGVRDLSSDDMLDNEEMFYTANNEAGRLFTHLQADSVPRTMRRDGYMRPTLVSLARLSESDSELATTNAHNHHHHHNNNAASRRRRCSEPEFHNFGGGAHSNAHAGELDDVRLPIAMDVSIANTHIALVAGCEDGRAFVLRFSVQTNPHRREKMSGFSSSPNAQNRMLQQEQDYKVAASPPPPHVTLCHFMRDALHFGQSNTSSCSPFPSQQHTTSYEFPVPITVQQQNHHHHSHGANSGRTSALRKLRSMSSRAYTEVVSVCDNSFTMSVSCSWGGILADCPLVQQARIFRVGEDNFCAVLVAVNGTCYAIDPDARKAVECTVRADSSAFTLIAGATSSIVPTIEEFLQQRESHFMDSTTGSSNAEQTTRLLRGQGERAVSCVCVSVDELCIYTIGEAFWGAARPGIAAPAASSQQQHATESRALGCSSQRLDEALGRRNSSHYHQEEDVDASDVDERALLLELGTTLMRLDANNNNNGGGGSSNDTAVEDVPEELRIRYARNVLTKGYSASEWDSLRWLDMHTHA